MQDIIVQGVLMIPTVDGDVKIFRWVPTESEIEQLLEL